MSSWKSRPDKKEGEVLNGLVTLAIEQASKRSVYNGFEAFSVFITIQTIIYVTFGDFLGIQILAWSPIAYYINDLQFDMNLAWRSRAYHLIDS